MTGPEHYREAAIQAECAAREIDDGEPKAAELSMRLALVHATLALTEATVACGLLRPEDRNEWDRVTGRLS